MGTYMDPEVAAQYPEIFNTSGLNVLHAMHRNLVSQIGPDRLVFIGDRLIRKVAVDVTDIHEFLEFYNQYKQGYFVNRAFHRVPATIVGQSG